MPLPPLSKKDFETLSHFRYQLRHFLRFSEEAAHHQGITHLQYQFAAAHTRVSGSRVGHRQRTGRASPGTSSRCGLAHLAVREAGAGAAPGGT